MPTPKGKLSTARCDDHRGQTFRVTHPYHPLFGQEFEMVSYHHTWAEARVCFQHSPGRLRALPVGWTSLAGFDGRRDPRAVSSTAPHPVRQPRSPAGRPQPLGSRLARSLGVIWGAAVLRPHDPEETKHLRSCRMPLAGALNRLRSWFIDCTHLTTPPSRIPRSK